MCVITDRIQCGDAENDIRHSDVVRIHGDPDRQQNGISQKDQEQGEHRDQDQPEDCPGRETHHPGGRVFCLAHIPCGFDRSEQRDHKRQDKSPSDHTDQRDLYLLHPEDRFQQGPGILHHSRRFIPHVYRSESGKRLEYSLHRVQRHHHDAHDAEKKIVEKVHEQSLEQLYLQRKSRLQDGQQNVVE